jgi:hypothetical protein
VGATVGGRKRGRLHCALLHIIRYTEHVYRYRTGDALWCVRVTIVAIEINVFIYILSA